MPCAAPARVPVREPAVGAQQLGSAIDYAHAPLPMPESPSPSQHPLAAVLRDGGEAGTSRRLAAFTAAYQELRGIARLQLQHERQNHTLQPTALVNEAFLRLHGSAVPVPTEPAALLAAAANTMRRVLVDHARARGRNKRGGATLRVPLDSLQLATIADAGQLLDLDAALDELKGLEPRLAEQTQLRLFAGLDDLEIATTLGISDRTVRRDWTLARAFLQRRLYGDA